MMSLRRDILLIVILFIITRLAVVAVGTAVNVYLPAADNPELKRLLDGGPALDMWYRWDAGFYASIASYGYTWYNEQRPAEDMAFLPAYPAAIRAVMDVTGCSFTPYLSTCATVAGLVVSNAALLIASYCLFDLTQRHFERRTAWRALILLMITPNVIFLSGVYTEALFLCLAVLTFWLLEREWFIAAVILSSVAALTRSVGVALFPALLWCAWIGTRDRRLPVRAARLALASLPVLAFAGYVLYAGSIAGDLGAYFRSYEVIWGRDVTRAPWETLAAYFGGDSVTLVGWKLSWIDLAAFVGYMALALIVLRRQPAWGLFALTAILLPFTSGTLTGMPRFGAVVFPFYIVLALWGRSAWRAALLYTGSAAMASLFIVRFVRLQWIA
jgi:hypothetical protein